MIIENLYIQDQNFSEVINFNLENMHFNIEALACNNAQTHVLIDHRCREISVFHYNHKLYKLLGEDRNKLDFSLFNKLLDEKTRKLIYAYIDIANKFFLHPTKFPDKDFYFTISLNINKNICMTGVKFRLIPLVYTPEKHLYASLFLIEPVNYIGEPILQMHAAKEMATLRYDHSSRTFIQEEDIQLTYMECDILRRSGEGEKESEIAANLNLSASSLKHMKQSIFDKLKVKTVSEAIYIAFKKGLI